MLMYFSLLPSEKKLLIKGKRATVKYGKRSFVPVWTNKYRIYSNKKKDELHFN